LKKKKFVQTRLKKGNIQQIKVGLTENVQTTLRGFQGAIVVQFSAMNAKKAR